MMELDYLPISISTLVPETCLGLELYLKATDSHRYTLYRGKDYPLSDADLTRLQDRGCRQVFITKESRETFQVYLRQVAQGDQLNAAFKTRVYAMNEVVRGVLESAFARDDTNETVTTATELGVVAAEIVTHDEFVANDLFQVLHHDYATFTHSANVAFYAAILASKLGLSSTDVAQIAVGGFLHDLGKLGIDDKILSKPGKLDDNEYRQIQMHPILGFRRLVHRVDLSEGQLMMVYQHHERPDGRGYPAGVTENEIHLWAKICAVVDVYEALTSHRPYRIPMPLNKALEIQQRDCGTAFNPEILKCWTMITKPNLAS